LGIEAPARSSLAYANARRPWELFEKVFYGLFEVCGGHGSLDSHRGGIS